MAVVSTFYDDFEDNTRDAAKWNAYPANFAETGGQLKGTFNANGSVTSVNTFDLIGSEIRFDTDLAAGSSLGNNYFQFGVYIGGFGTIYGWHRQGFNIHAYQGSQIIASATAYDTPYRYLRVRAFTAGANNTINWDRSADQTTWTTFHTTNLSAGTNPLTGVTVFVRTTNYQGSPLSAHLALSSVNPQSVPPPVTSPQVWVWDGSTKLAATAKVWDGSTKLAATPKIAP